jgi:hypothetical protein
MTKYFVKVLVVKWVDALTTDILVDNETLCIRRYILKES